MDSALQFFKALSDETRLRLLLVLNRYELNVNELVDILAMGQSRVSRHLKILSASGLLSSRRDGLWIFYSAVHDGSGRAFIDAIFPFLEESGQTKADLAMAAGIIDERTSKTNQFFNTIAEDWDHMARELLGNFAFENHVLDLMPAHCQVAVDLGCGTGSMLGKFLLKADTAIGVDGSARMLELARRRLGDNMERISLRIGDLEHLPLRDAEADFVSINLVLHHLSSPQTVLQEVKRVLSPGGVFVLSDFDKHENESLRAEYGDRWLGFSAATLKEFMLSAGFTMINNYTHPVEKDLSVHFFQAHA